MQSMKKIIYLYIIKTNNSPVIFWIYNVIDEQNMHIKFITNKVANLILIWSNLHITRFINLFENIDLFEDENCLFVK